MASPDGNGNGTGEGRKRALLLLRGDGPTGPVDSDGRASSLPSANALRPDSNLNLGWYRPIEGEPPAERADHPFTGLPYPRDWQRGAAAELDLEPVAAPNGAAGSPLGARRPTKPAAAGAAAMPSGTFRALRSAGAILRDGRLTWPVMRARWASGRHVAASAGVMGVALLGVTAMTLLSTSAQFPRGARTHIQSEPNPTQLPNGFVSVVIDRLDALNRSEQSNRTSATGTSRMADRNRRPPPVRHGVFARHHTSSPSSTATAATTRAVAVATVAGDRPRGAGVVGALHEASGRESA